MGRNYGEMIKALVFVLIAAIVIMIILWVAQFMFGIVTWFTDVVDFFTAAAWWPIQQVDTVVSDIGNAMGGTDYGTGSSYVELTTGVVNFVGTSASNFVNWMLSLFGAAGQALGG